MSTSTLSLVARNGSSRTITPRPVSRASSTASSLRRSDSLLDDDDDTAEHTITGKRVMVRTKQPSQEDLRLLAVSAQMTEVSYNISDIQTRIFEIQELRHQTLTDTPDTPTLPESSGVIDQALINLDERLEAVSVSIGAIDEVLGIAPNTDSTVKASPPRETVDAALLRKHASLIEDWEAVQSEADVLRDELKEDKWLAVFRTVSEQAEGMMSSLEKGITQCHDFIWQVHRRSQEDMQSVSSSASITSDRPVINYEVFNALLQSFEAKKKYYMPSITKVLSVLDKGVRDRVTKNGECLRRHADLRARWRNLRERIGRIDTEMEGVRRLLVNRDHEPSEAGSAVSRTTTKSRNGFLGTSASSNGSASRTASSSSAIARSISPFANNLKKFASKVSDKFTGRATPSVHSTPASSMNGSARAPHSDPAPTMRNKTSFFPFRSSNAPETPPRPKHGHSQSLAVDHSPQSSLSVTGSVARPTGKDRWNSSTKVEPGQQPPMPTGTMKPIVRKRSSTALLTPSSLFRSISPHSSTGVSPAAQHSGFNPPSPPAASSRTPPRPPSRAMSRAQTPGGSHLPRPRAVSPSNIPVPKGSTMPSDLESEDDSDGMPTTLMQRAMSPAFSVSAKSATSSPQTTGGRSHTPGPRPRTPSHSLIPIPRLNLPGSRPGSALGRPASTTPDSRSQTPEATLRARAQQVPFFGSQARPPLPRSGTATGSNKAGPPSSFREASATPPRVPSRAGSRLGAPSLDRGMPPVTPGLDAQPVPIYVPVKTDPLDVEVAKCVNGLAHGFLIERVDPPLKAPPRPGEEVRAQYAISNALARKVIQCRLVVISRQKGLVGTEESRKVMCRVGGGWQELQMYLLIRQAGTQ